MPDMFITKIHIDKVRHLHDIDIELSNAERRHLILTGRNGSGKTSLLEAMRLSIQHLQTSNATKPALTDLRTTISYSCSFEYLRPCAFFVFIAAERSGYELPQSIEPVNIRNKQLVTLNASRDFLRYILSLDYQLYGAKTDNNTRLEKNLKDWFENFLETLRTIYDCPELKLQRDAKNLAFKIEMPGRAPFALHEMSDGYAAFLKIYMELLMRFEGLNDDAIINYNSPAIVLIDEIETHLHVELQKRVLPFLTQMFPKTQFIVSTHSPFVINSLRDAVVYDLEKLERLDNPGIYSYEAVVEGFLDVGQYSVEMQNTFKRYRELCAKTRAAEEETELGELVSLLSQVPPASKELYLAFRKMEDERRR